MKIKVGDQVKVIAGADKGKTGKVLQTLKKDNKVIVENVNIRKRHQKPNQMNQKGGIIEFNAPIHVSNVQKVEGEKAPKATTKKATTTKKTSKKEEKKD